jgi:phosphomannomutase
MDLYSAVNNIPLVYWLSSRSLFRIAEEGKGALALAMATADRSGATLIIANDPDADRMAVAEKAPLSSGGQWRVFTGNETGILLAHWLWSKHQESHEATAGSHGLPPRMIASTVSSKMLASMAEAEGFTFQETLTGFKWMGNAVSSIAFCRALNGWLERTCKHHVVVFNRFADG